MNTTESILRNKVQSELGWNKTELPKQGRTIKIGNERNCNDDGIVPNPTIKNDIEEVMKKYDIDSYHLDKIHTQFEFSYQIYLTEKDYQTFSEKLINL